MYKVFMENSSEILYKNSEKIHTTEMGIERSKKKILDKRSSIIKKGKNWYISIEDIMIAVNAYST